MCEMENKKSKITKDFEHDDTNKLINKFMLRPMWIKIEPRQYFKWYQAKVYFSDKKEFNLIIENFEINHNFNKLILNPFKAISIEYNLNWYEIIKNYDQDTISIIQEKYIDFYNLTCK